MSGKPIILQNTDVNSIPHEYVYINDLSNTPNFPYI